MVLKRWLLLGLLCLPFGTWGQVDYAVEQWLQDEGSEAMAAEWSDQWAEWQANPININDTSALVQLPFLTPFHRQALRNYILLYGELLSVKELALVPGFDSALLSLIIPIVKAEPLPQQSTHRWWEGHHTLTFGLGGTIEQAAGYSNGHYEGDNLHALMCYSYNYRNHLHVGLATDKDPTEPWGKHNFRGYHLMVNDIGRIERAIVGHYSLQFGQGLTLWSGLQPFDIVGQSPERFGSGVRRAGTFSETDYLNGAAATVRLWHGLKATAFASLSNGTTLAGGHIEWRHHNLIVGTTATYTYQPDSLFPRDLTYNQLAFRERQLGNFGVDALWQIGHLLLYGETALDHEGHAAALGGVKAQLDGGQLLGISLRHFSPRYHNHYAQPYGFGTHQGEQGVRLDMQSSLPMGFKGKVSTDLHRFTSLRYATYRPSEGAMLKAQVEKRWLPHLATSFRYSYRKKSRNVPNLDSTLYTGEYTHWQQLQAEVKSEWSCMTFAAKWASVLFDSENGDLQRGTMVALTTRYTRGCWQAGSALAYFSTDGYYTRLYLTENTIQYAWSMPALYGKGWRAYLLLRYTLDNHLSVAAKYALTTRPGEEAIGSGDAQTLGPTRQTWHIQVRWNF